MTRAELDQVLDELRAAGTDHSAVEAKRARTELPRSVWETLSAFANTDGGIVLLGIDETNNFEVVGVDDPARVTQALQSACAELEPPLRPLISVVDYDGRQVIVAELAAVARSARPCHRRGQGPAGSSFIRVGDADQALTQAEIDEMLANRSSHDQSRRPAPDQARLDAAAAAGFCARVRTNTDGAPADDGALLHRWGAQDENGQPTIAGLLALGEEPAGIVAAARLAYSVLRGADGLVGERQRGRHLEGRVGELLDQTTAQLVADLGPVQVERDGHLIDETDVPAIAIREIVSNALLHRSLTAAEETTSISVKVDNSAIVITSPGGLHFAADTGTLGLDPISGVRNLALVRICEQLQTPAGYRIIENQAGGIARADEACRELGTMPPLFIDHPTRFQVILLRGGLDTGAASALLEERGIDPTAECMRLVAVATRLRRVAEDTPISGFERIAVDARLAARALAPSTVEDASSVLLELERAGIFTRQHLRHGASWTLAAAPASANEAAPAQVEEEQPPQAEQPEGGRRRRRDQPDRVPDVLRAIADSPNREALSSEIGLAMNLASPSSVNKWIRRAGEAGLIEPTNENLQASNRRYRLTRGGEERLRRD